MKTVYLVRHGETNANLAKTWQDPFDELSPRGFLQAENLATRLQELYFDLALSSSYKRAMQTAEVIQKRTGLVFTYSDNFVEVKNPSSTIGIKQEKAPGNKIFEYLQARDSAVDKDNFRFEDEETLAELIKRGRAALVELTKAEATSILVVTPGTIMRTIVNLVLSQHDTSRLAADIFYGGRFMQTVNTGITVLNYDEETELWSLLTFNDHAHFAD